MPPYFCSRNITYRRPFGAVSAGTAVFFRLRLPRSLGCRGAFLRTAENETADVTSSLFWAGETGDGDEWWDCHFTPPRPGLYWYDFYLTTDHGTRFLSAGPDKEAFLAEAPGARWQLTAYAADFKTPDWLCGGVMYQIFPDRFCRSRRTPRFLPAGRKYHENWDDPVEFRPDKTGEIRNNDFFGGDLKGVGRSLRYLKRLGVTCIYLNPIFEASSNHRYDTADYRTIDPLLGDEADFRRLAKTARRLGIRLILDGVFSHTGADSRYFNQAGRYPPIGACDTQQSPYYSWYKFRHWPDDYVSWWGFRTLPELHEEDPDYLRFITGPDGVVPYWLNAGASGWRLDVADELPDVFLDALRQAAKAADSDALILGEVWEDASNKVSYGHRRRYLLGRQLDSVMNYPFRTAVLSFVRDGDGTLFFRRIGDIAEHYPPPVLRLLMNPLSTHDTTRAITALSGEDDTGRDREWQAATVLSPAQRELGRQRLKLASALQYCLPGVPCLYYGDEAGAEGYRDPFNRGTFPFGREDKDLTDWFARLGTVRGESPSLREGCFIPLAAAGDTVCFVREGEGHCLLCAVNRGENTQTLSLPIAYRHLTNRLGEGLLLGSLLQLPPRSCLIATGPAAAPTPGEPA